MPTRPIHSLLTFAVLVVTACTAVTPSAPVGAQGTPLQIRSSAVPFKIDDPQARQIGRLIWRGGIAMTANSRNFGGWSDLHISPDGTTLTAISDEGSWLTASVEYDAQGNLAGLAGRQIGSLRGLDGRPLADKSLADAEGMARLSDGSWLVSFERQHRIWRYPTLDGTPAAIELPPDFGRQPNNGGVEALVGLADGRIVAISEDYSQRTGSVVGWIGQAGAGGGYTWRTFSYATIADFQPTAIAQLPDGSLVTVERAFDFLRGVRCRIMRFDLSQLQPDGTVQPEELARLASPYAVDNLEGLAVTTGRRGETLLWMMSDDNFNPAQRNLLLLFELAK
jgi:hypothetical protein